MSIVWTVKLGDGATYSMLAPGTSAGAETNADRYRVVRPDSHSTKQKQLGGTVVTRCSSPYSWLWGFSRGRL